MNPLKWKDYKYGSWLVVSFGTVDARVDILGWNAAGVANHFGILIHPTDFAELLPGSNPDGSDPTFEQAKIQAHTMLSAIILPAAAALKTLA